MKRLSCIHHSLTFCTISKNAQTSAASSISISLLVQRHCIKQHDLCPGHLQSLHLPVLSCDFQLENIVFCNTTNDYCIRLHPKSSQICYLKYTVNLLPELDHSSVTFFTSALKFLHKVSLEGHKSLKCWCHICSTGQNKTY